MPGTIAKNRDLIALPPSGGRHYAMGKLSAVFKADEDETGSGYSISEWIIEPGQQGVGAHHHDENDEVFYVLEGEPDVLTGETWGTYAPGSFLRIPAGMTHDFRNNGDQPAKLLNVFIPGGFERSMPGIVKWFEDNPDQARALRAARASSLRTRSGGVASLASASTTSSRV